MNYFEFYHIPESFYPDEQVIRQQYYKLSREYHPDFYANENPEKQREILELATRNTNAYHTLSQFDRRLQYILETHGLLAEGAKNEIPADFLMEMMELNEELMELEIEFDAEVYARIKFESEGILNDLEADIKPVLEKYPELPQKEKLQALEQAKNYYLKKKYLLRIQETLTKFAA